MDERDLTSARLSERSGVSKTSIDKYLKGHIKPAAEVLMKLSEGLGCTVEDIDRPKTIKEFRKPGNMSVAMAAVRLGVSEQYVRIALQRGMYPFGVALRKEDGKKYSYQISPERFEAYLRGELA